LDQFSAGAETLSAETRQQGRRELAAELNLAARRIRQATTLDELISTLADAASPFADGSAVFRIAGGAAKSEKLSIEIPLTSAAALAGVVENGDPVTAAATATEVSAALIERLEHTPDARAYIYPIAVKRAVPALLYAWGDVLGAALELLTEVTAACWDVLDAPPPLVELVNIAPAAANKPAASWESLDPEEQRVHLRAQRFARVQAAAIRLQEGTAIQSGRSRRNLYDTLRTPIDAARTQFRKNFFGACPSMVDYLHLELVRTLANDDAELLGKDYPGRLV